MATQSISFAIIAISAGLALSLLVTSGISFTEMLGNSLEEQIEQQEDFEDTDFRIQSTGFNANGEFETTIRNTGESSIFVRDIHFLIDGKLQEPSSSTVQSNNDRSLLQPREEATFVFDGSNPSSLKIVFPNGVTESTST